jgi:hypothetical protein
MSAQFAIGFVLLLAIVGCFFLPGKDEIEDFFNFQLDRD